jgi:internalin A
MSLRALMIVVLILGGWLGWLVRGARIQHEAVAAVERGGGSVKYDWEWRGFQFGPNGRRMSARAQRSGPPWPNWLVARLGPDFFADVKEVRLGPKDPDIAMAQVATLGRLASLQTGVESPITDDGIRHIRGLTGLESFTISQRASKITGACVESLKGLTRLRALIFTTKPPLTDADLAHLRNLTALQELQLPSGPGSQITDAGLVNLEGMTDMRYLGISRQALTSAGLAHVRGMTQLAHLWAPGTRIEDLAPIAGLTRMSFLQLASTPITDAGLAPVAGFTALHDLFLGDTTITDAGLVHLRGLTNLAELDLHHTQITDAGLAHLAGLKSLSRLTLADTRVTDAGLVHLAGLDSLQRVSFYQTGITDAGLVHLGKIASLTSLNLCETRITDAGLEHLAGLKGLTSLMIQGTRVTDAGITALQAALPGVQIVKPASIGPYR